MSEFHARESVYARAHLSGRVHVYAHVYGHVYDHVYAPQCDLMSSFGCRASVFS